MTRLPKMIGVAVAGAMIGLSPPGVAQTYPNQPVRIIVPFGAGSSADILGRILADRLTARWGQNVFVENRPGVTGTTVAAKSAPDGHTLMLTSNGHTMVGVINKNLSFDPVKDFAAITPIANVPMVLIVSPGLSARTLAEFIALTKQNPGKFNYPSPGVGSTSFIASEMFKEAAGIDMIHVPYKGAPDCITSVVRRDTQMYFVPVNVGTELIEAGQVRALAIATAERNPSLTNVPTMREAGLDFVYDSWFGLMAPAATPRDIVAKINRDTVDILTSAETKAKLDSQGVIPMPRTPEQFDQMVADGTRKMTQMFKGN